MAITFVTAKIVGDSDNFNWGGVFAENGLFIIVEVKGNEEIPAVNQGREVLDLLLTKFTDLKTQTMDSVLKLIQEVKEKEYIISLVIGLLENDSLHLASQEGGQAFLLREKKFGRILQSSGRSTGIIKNEDILLVTSSSFTLVIPKENIIDAMLILDTEQIAEKLVPQILEKKDVRGVCALVVKFSADKKPEGSLSDLLHWKDKIAGGIRLTVDKLGRIVKRKDVIAAGESLISQDPQKVRTKKTLLTVSVSLVVLLIFSVFFNINHTQDVKRREKLDEVLTLVTQQYEEASNLIDLNPVRARELLESSKLSLAPLLGEFPKNSDEFKTTTEWIGKISSQEVIAYKIYKLTAVPVFFDLSLVKTGGEGKKMAGYKDTKVILDTKNKVVYTLSTATKQSAIVAGGDTVKEAQTITVHGNNAYILNSDGVVSIDIPSRSAKVAIKPDEKWGDIGSLYSFGGNLYLLDRKNNTIWKYIATDFGFSGRTTYLNPDVRANFTKSLRMVIDGSVWVADPDEITKFTRGLAEQFAFKGFSETLHNIISISSSDTDNFIYLLDRETARIVVFDKDGSYQSQYQWDELINADDMVATEEEKEIFVLAGSRIYAIELK